MPDLFWATQSTAAIFPACSMTTPFQGEIEIGIEIVMERATGIIARL
jgi:hypothetical protein